MNGDCEPPLNMSVPRRLGRESVGWVCLSALGSPALQCPETPRRGPKTAIGPFPPSLYPARALAGFEAWVRWAITRNSRSRPGEKPKPFRTWCGGKGLGSGCGGEEVLRRTKNPQGRRGLGGSHDAALGLAGLNHGRDRHERRSRRRSQSALLMTNTAASSLVVVHEPPAHTSTPPRIKAAAAIKTTILRMVLSSPRAR
jgi:hypothetical protein